MSTTLPTNTADDLFSSSVGAPGGIHEQAEAEFALNNRKEPERMMVAVIMSKGFIRLRDSIMDLFLWNWTG